MTMKPGMKALLLLAAMTALPLATAIAQPRIQRTSPWSNQPINTGRRAVKDATALAKAEAKRQRKNAKRRGAG